MANPTNISKTADDAASQVKKAGDTVAEGARKAGEATAETASAAGDRSAAQIRRSGPRGDAAVRGAVDDFDERVGSLEDSIRRNPLAAAGAALLVGVVLGRFFL